MTTVTKAQARDLAAFEALQKELPGGAPWLAQLRKNAISRFSELGYPTPKDEAWKYTSVKPLRDAGHQPVTRDAAGRATADDVARYAIEGLTGTRLVFVDGHYSEALSQLGDLPEGVRVQSLREALEEDPALLEEHLDKHASHRESAFAALNTALFQDGVLVHARRGAVAEEPVHALYLSTARDDAGAAHVRNLVVAEESSQITVVESYGYAGDAGEAPFHTNVVTEVAAGDNAVVDHYRVQREADSAHHTSSTGLTLGRDSNARTFTVTLSGGLVRNDLVTSLTGEGGDAGLNGLFALDGAEHVDNHTRINHLAPHCDSREYYKGVLDGKARGVFYGLIYVAKGAQQTDSYQHNPNLILSEDALVDSTPGLEIYADDVKCSHGSTIGQIDKAQLFYLMSRGLDRDTARSMLVYAFAADVLERVKPAALRARLDALLLEKLPGGEHVRAALGAGDAAAAGEGE